jgi:hypothetical protein
VQRYRCSQCGRCFSSQTFSLTYWLRRPDLPRRIFLRLLSCSAYRQIARDLGVSPTTVLRQVERLGRDCLLFHERLRPKQPLSESLVVDGLEAFELSQYTPVHFHTAVGGDSHYVYGFTDSELRRKGRIHRVDQQCGESALLEANRVLDRVLDHRQQEALGLARTGAGRDDERCRRGREQVFDGVALMQIRVCVSGALLQHLRECCVEAERALIDVNYSCRPAEVIVVDRRVQR